MKEHQKDGQGQAPTFTVIVAVDCILQIALGMEALHKHDLLHRDLKAANILVREATPFHDGTYSLGISDFEHSECTAATGFWRAPEILRALNAISTLPLESRTKLPFTREADVYSFGMTCYEVLTGKIPFEDHPQSSSSIDKILFGDRPKLPHYLDKNLKKLIGKCWEGDPLIRPTFTNILFELVDIIAETKGLQGVLQRLDINPSRSTANLRLEIGEFEQELESIKSHDPQSFQRGRDYLESIKKYLTQCEVKVASAYQPFSDDKYTIYEEATRLYKQLHKSCRIFTSGLVPHTQNNGLNRTHCTLIKAGTELVFHMP